MSAIYYTSRTKFLIDSAGVLFQAHSTRILIRHVVIVWFASRFLNVGLLVYPSWSVLKWTNINVSIQVPQ